MLLLLVAFLLPYFLKRYIETHSEEWIERKITIDHIILNPFTFRYAVAGVTGYEPKGDVVYVSWKDIHGQRRSALRTIPQGASLRSVVRVTPPPPSCTSPAHQHQYAAHRLR